MTKTLKKSAWDRLKVWWSLYWLLWPTVVAWLCGFVTFVIGFAYSDQETSLPFSRSGSVVTAIFILSTIFSVDRAAKRQEQRAIKLFRNVTKGLPLTGEDSQKKIEEKTAGNTDSVLRLNLFLSAIGLCLATLVWGFGDLLADSQLGSLLAIP